MTHYSKIHSGVGELTPVAYLHLSSERRMVGDLSVVVVHPYPILREGLVRVLTQGGRIDCTGFGLVDDIPETTAGGEKRVVFLLDLGQDDSAIAHGIRSLKERFPESRIVVLAERYCHSHMLISLETGAHGYLINQISCEALVKSLELVSLGEQVYPAQALQSLNGKLPSEARQKQAITEPPVSLSAREADVLKCLSQGKTNKLIARQWGISEATVKVHVKAILRKIHLKNRTEAALWARDHGLGADPVNSNGMG